MERIEIKHNKKVTALFCALYLLGVIGLGACIAAVTFSYSSVTAALGVGLAITLLVLLSLCALTFMFLTACQIAKLRRDIIFIADERGITDYSRHIVLKPILYSEIKSIEYKGFMETDVEVSDLRHLKIVLKNSREYMRKNNVLQKISFVLGFCHIELHLFGGKCALPELAEKLRQNLNEFNSTVKS